MKAILICFIILTVQNIFLKETDALFGFGGGSKPTPAPTGLAKLFGGGSKPTPAPTGLAKLFGGQSKSTPAPTGLEKLFGKPKTTVGKGADFFAKVKKEADRKLCVRINAFPFLFRILFKIVFPRCEKGVIRHNIFNILHQIYLSFGYVLGAFGNAAGSIIRAGLELVGGAFKSAGGILHAIGL